MIVSPEDHRSPVNPYTSGGVEESGMMHSHKPLHRLDVNYLSNYKDTTTRCLNKGKKLSPLLMTS
jgi:hypothetical protein